MDNIITDDGFVNFDFKKLTLTKPTQISGGNYFIRFLTNNAPLYIQPPKCSTKQGIIKAGKRYYSDLMFTNENEMFINWMEKLETYCQQYIFDNRAKWFDSEMELHDIENYFTSPLKLYKSGKYYIVRINISTVLGKPILKIYDENESEINLETINDKMNIMTILEIQGIKCSSRSFQIEIEMKQMMVLKPQDLFEKCLFKTSGNKHGISHETSLHNNANDIKSEMNESNEIQETIKPNLENLEIPEQLKNEIILNNVDDVVNIDDDKHVNSVETPLETQLEISIKIPEPIKNTDGMEEVEFHLEELPETDTLQLKERNDVYYELYREAKRKAKIARDFAISAYLEAKEIKNTYMLDEIDDEESDEEDDFNFEEERE
jgi:hypothetical protein